MSLISQFLGELKKSSAVLVCVHSTRGSTPREVGAWMAVFADMAVGTVGGGRLEWDATAHARKLLVQTAHSPALADEEVVRYALGPSLGQCCGGEVYLRYERVDATHIATLRQRLAPVHTPVALFGGGHVGNALITVLGKLPVDVTWVDSRDEIFPAHVPANVHCEHSDPVHAAVAHLPAGSQVLTMSFSHAQDLEVVAACLQRQRQTGDLPYVGLIGSKAKWASFRQRLLARGFTPDELAHITSPIGIAGIADKRPEVIAVAVAAQLLQTLSAPSRSPHNETHGKLPT